MAMRRRSLSTARDTSSARMWSLKRRTPRKLVRRMRSTQASPTTSMARVAPLERMVGVWASCMVRL